MAKNAGRPKDDSLALASFLAVRPQYQFGGDRRGGCSA